MTKERWAQLGITLQFVIVVRTLGEIFRLHFAGGPGFTAALCLAYTGGALIATCCCWASVTLYFFRRYLPSALIAPAAIIVLLIYKVRMIGG